MAGEELLIVDASDRNRDGLRKYFDARGYVCTAVATSEQALQHASAKFFPAALVDLDVDGPEQGLDLLRFLRERSPATSTVLITSHKSFDGAVEAFRLGVLDVIVKSSDQVERMREVVETAAARHRAKDSKNELWREVASVLDDSFRLLIEQSRRVYADLSLAAPPIRPKVLFVDGDGEFLNSLAPLAQTQKWDVLADMNGGAALDRASRERVDILVVRGELPDLRGSMVVRTIQTEHPEVIGLLYSEQGEGGRVDVYLRGQIDRVVRPFHEPAHLIEAVKSASVDLATRAQERRIIQAFRQDNTAFVRRYAALKQKLDTLLG